MIEETIARRYARALIDIGKEDENYKQYGAELASFAALVEQNRDLEIFLLNPIFETHNGRNSAPYPFVQSRLLIHLCHS